MLRTFTRLFIIACFVPIAAAQYGDCSGSVKLELLDDGRQMRLLEDYVYIDGAAKRWLAPKPRVVDGASIPRFLWSFIGGPWEGTYRKASVVHDIECDDEKEPWRAVHRMFFNAMRCSGVSETRAKIMYSAVYQCGPRWGDDQGYRFFPCTSAFMKQFVRRWKTLAYQNAELSLEQLEEITPELLTQLAVDPVAELRRKLKGRATVDEGEKGFVITVQMPAGSAAAMSASTEKLVEEIGQILKTVPQIRILVEGHADAVGSEEYNFALSQHRTQIVAEKLSEAGIPRETMSTVSYGENRPVAPNDTNTGRQLNRRVEIVVLESL